MALGVRRWEACRGARRGSPRAAFSSRQGRRRRPGAANVLGSALTCGSGPDVRPTRCLGRAPPACTGPCAPRAAQRGEGAGPGAAGYKQRNPLLLPAPAPSSLPGTPHPCSPVPRPARAPRFPYLRAGVRGSRHRKRMRGAPRRQGPGAGTRSREADPAVFPAQSCHCGGSWEREELGEGAFAPRSSLGGGRGSDPSWGEGLELGEGLGLRGKLRGAGEMGGSTDPGRGLRRVERNAAGTAFSEKS